MTLVFSPTQSDVTTALRSFLLDILPAGVPVILAQVNRVPQPPDVNSVEMTPLLQKRLATNLDEFDFSAGLSSVEQNVMTTIQLDFFGPQSGDYAQMTSTLFRDDYALTFFAGLSSRVAPLYADDPKQAPFSNENQQIQDRWTVDAVLQVNGVISNITTQSADELAATLLPIEANYPVT